MSSEEICDYIGQAKELSSIKVVVFTGGECFLLGRDLERAVAYASSMGFVTRFVSNGFWGTSRPVAKRRLEGLVNGGLKEANFTTGHQHSRYVNPKYVKNAAIEACDLGLTTVVVVEIAPNSDFNLDQFLGDSEFRLRVDEGKISLRPSYWMPFTDAEVPCYSKEAVDGAIGARGACDSVLSVLTVTPDKKLYACCGLAIQEIAELCLGDLNRESIYTLVKGSKNDAIKIWLHQEGPAKIIEYLSAHNVEMEQCNYKTHICDVCRALYRSDSARNTLLDIAREKIDNIVQDYRHTLILKGSVAPATFRKRKIWKTDLNAIKSIMEKC